MYDAEMNSIFLYLSTDGGEPTPVLYDIVLFAMYAFIYVALLHNEVLCNLYRTLYVVRVIKKRDLMRETRSQCRLLVEKPLEKRTPER